MAKKITMGLLCFFISFHQVLAVRHPSIETAHQLPERQSVTLPAPVARHSVQQRPHHVFTCTDNLMVFGGALVMCAIELELILLATHKYTK